MGKHKDKDRDREDGSSSKKKSKKHKKHKKKHSKVAQSDNEEIDVVNDDLNSSQDDGKSMFKLKIKFGGRTLSTTEVVSDNTTADEPEANNEDELDQNKKQAKSSTSRLEEDRWLDALEKGELDDTGGLKKEKDISLMTTRQRALHGEKIASDVDLLQLPMYPERTEEENEEFERKRQVRARKRKQQMKQQIEDTKTQTVEKLLTKGQKAAKKDVRSSQKGETDHVRYTNGKDGICISWTSGMDMPMNEQIAKEPPKPILCSVSGCENIKKYACVNTSLPVCSLQCYKLVNTPGQSGSPTLVS